MEQPLFVRIERSSPYALLQIRSHEINQSVEWTEEINEMSCIQRPKIEEEWKWEQFVETQVRLNNYDSILHNYEYNHI